MKIAVDAMGGDHAPYEVVKGAVNAAAHNGIHVVLVGQSERIEKELAQYPNIGDNIEIKHASEVVAMDDNPSTAMRRKPESSIVVGIELVKSGEAQAFVSAGNTGAVMAISTLRLGRIKGIDRPAICCLVPSLKGKVILLDAGATVDCEVENLLQFALMGNEYAQKIQKISKPKIGLLSIGEEPTKGDELTKSANARLSQTNLNFIGNVEGKDVFRGTADVVVCDGFAGNMVLKVAEGISEFIQVSLKNEVDRKLIYKIGAKIMHPAFRAVMQKSDYCEYGGAPLLGVNGVTIISHGRSNSQAIQNAIRAASDAAKNNIVECISASVQQEELTV